ncbi:MAG: extracellular solute-binding protein [Acidobacteria bacterium]|nr:extracellular solute-binding protein [Acidobacteriota bacterium]
MTHYLTRRQWLAAAVGLAGCRLGNHQGVVNWGSWQGHIESNFLSEFQKRNGVAVNPIGIADNAENLLRTKLGGPRTFDLMQADGLWCRKYYEAGLIEPIDLGAIPTAKKNLYEEFRSVPGMTEGGKLLQLNWGWSPWILAYNKKKVVPPPASWKVLWDPRYKGRVVMYSGTRPFIIAALILGYPPWNMNTEQLSKAAALLLELKANLLKFNTETLEVQSLLGSESAWIALEASPGRVTRIQRDGGPEIGWTIPQEGTFAWVDGDMLIKGAPNRAAALKLLDFIHGPEYVAQNMKRIPRGCCNRAAVEALLRQGEKALVEENLMDRPDLLARTPIDRAPSDLDAYANAWNRVLAG